MVLANGADDLERSTRLNFDLSCGAECGPLIERLLAAVIEHHDLNPRPSSRVQLRETIDCLLANLWNACRMSGRCFLAVPMRTGEYRSDRYHTRGIGYTNMVRVIDYLRGIDPPLVTYRRGFRDRRRDVPIGRLTRLRATRGLINEVRRIYQRAGSNADPHGVPIPITGRISIPYSVVQSQPSSDPIRLKSAQGQLIDYADNDATNRMRRRLESWNSFLVNNHHVDILVSDNELETVFEADDEDAFFTSNDPTPSYVDLTKVRLHRVFNGGSFEQGGRFYGGWWQQVPSSFRQFITINGYPTVELDYSNLHAAMLYAREGLPLPTDAYALDNVPAEQYRKLIKTSFFKLINALPRQRIRAPAVDMLPPDYSWRQLQAAIAAKHEPIARHFRSGIGLEFQRLDSDIAEDVMRAMMARDALVLPVHDSFITYYGTKDRLLVEMKRAYRDRMRADIGVAADTSFLDGLAEVEGPYAEDVIEAREAEQGYEGYRSRLEAFRRTRTQQWRQRFGGEQVL